MLCKVPIGCCPTAQPFAARLLFLHIPWLGLLGCHVPVCPVVVCTAGALGEQPSLPQSCVRSSWCEPQESSAAVGAAFRPLPTRGETEENTSTCSPTTRGGCKKDAPVATGVLQPVGTISSSALGGKATTGAQHQRCRCAAYARGQPTGACYRRPALLASAGRCIRYRGAVRRRRHG